MKRLDSVKNIAALIAAAMAILMISAQASFAADFAIDHTYPEDGATNTTKENMCVKVFFTSDVGNKDSRAANKDAFKITNSKGKEIPSVIYYNKKDSKYALIHIDTTKVPQTGKNAIKDDTDYICTISGSFRDNEGNTLGEDQVIKFKTMNQGRSMMIYMVLMMVFMVAMVVFTVIQSRKQLMEAAEAGDDSAFNPYKEAKRTGKTVEQVIREHEKKGEKSGLAALLSGSSDEDDEGEELPEGHYRVKSPRPISAAGSEYKTGRKAEAEAEAAKREKEKAERKAKGYTKKQKKEPETGKKGKGKSKKK